MAPTPNRSRHLTTYADTPITSVDEDALGFRPYADAFALLINDLQTATPLIVSISGPWGCGKTSLARLIEQRLAVDEYWRLGWNAPPITCWFNAWLHADAERLGAALAASVARDIGRRRPLRWRMLSPLPDVMLTPESRWWRRVGRGVAGAALAVLALLGILALAPELRPSQGALGRLFGQWAEVTVWWAALPVGFTLLRRTFRVTDALGRFVDEPKSAAALGSLAEVHAQVGRIVRQAQRRTLRGSRAKRRLVIFIDDLERCPGAKALDVCEVAAQLLAHGDVVTVLVADLDVIAAAAADRYPWHGGAEQPDRIGERYLHKVTQVRFNLPPLTPENIATVLARHDPTATIARGRA
jgi:hypothetical protein